MFARVCIVCLVNPKLRAEGSGVSSMQGPKVIVIIACWLTHTDVQQSCSGDFAITG